MILHTGEHKSLVGDQVQYAADLDIILANYLLAFNVSCIVSLLAVICLFFLSESSFLSSPLHHCLGQKVSPAPSKKKKKVLTVSLLLIYVNILLTGHATKKMTHSI